MKKIFILLLLLASSTFVLSQTLKKVTVSGVVIDEMEQPIVGATIFLKNKPRVGTSSGKEGKFEIKATEGDVLTVSMIGYNTFEYLLRDDQKDLKVKLTEKKEEVDEVVVTALGASQRKISMVGAVTTVDVAQLQSPATSIPNMLGGRVAGIISQQRSGEPGKNISEFWVRGIGTFGQSDGALILIDGIEGSLDNIDPADIESFSILKDASATALYGVRGANGVVIVTTKKGQSGKLSITARGSVTLSHLKNVPEYLNGYDYAVLANESRMVRNDLPIYDDIELEKIKYQLDPDFYPNVNWRDEILKKTSMQQNYYMSAQGGGNIARYFISVGLSDEQAAYKQDKSTKYDTGIGFNRYTFRSNIDMNLTKTTVLGFLADGQFTKRTEPSNASTDELWYAQARLTPVSIPKMYSTGHIPAVDEQAGGFSPWAMLNHTGLKSLEYTNSNYSLTLNQDLEFILKGLTLRAQGTMRMQTWMDEKRFIRPSLWRAVDRTLGGDLVLTRLRDKEPVQYSSEQNQERTLHFESTINYNRVFADDHRFSALVYYYMNDNRSGNHKTSLEALPKRYQGISSRITYGYRDTYLVDVNFGYTGSENFQRGARFGFFPSIAFGWVPTQYAFVRDAMPWLSHLKIRGSYGLVGNDKITDRRFPYLTEISENTGTGWGSTTGGIRENYIGADNLAWEKSKKTNIGLDSKFFNNKLDFTIDFFNDQRDGIFQPRVQIPGYVGLVNMPYSNTGRMRSWGTDGTISYTAKINKDMHFTVRGNFTYSKNKVQYTEEDFKKYPYQSEIGWSHWIRRGYIAMGLFSDDEDIANSPAQEFGQRVRPGDIKYKDVNGDGYVNGDDMVPISYPDHPRLMYGFGGEFNYKNLTLGVLFKGRGKTDFYWTQNRGGLGYIPFAEGQFGNVLAIAGDPKNRWTPREYSGTADTENPNARFPRLSYGYNQNNQQVSTFWRANSKYLRLQEISLTYRLTANPLKKIGVSSIDLQLVAENLHVWDDIKLFDPELAYAVGEKYPIPSRYTFQLYIHF